MDKSRKDSLSFYGGVFLVTLATLMLQVVETRILSAVTWYHLAFFVISIGMFGLTAGAVWVYLRRERFTQATLSHDLAYFSTAFAIATAVSLVIQMGLPLHGGGRPTRHEPLRRARAGARRDGLRGRRRRWHRQRRGIGAVGAR